MVAADYFRLAGDARRAATTITNGVDPADVPAAAGSPPADRFRLSFVGTLYGTIDLAPVMAALRAADRRRARSTRRASSCGSSATCWLPGLRARRTACRWTQTGYVSHDERDRRDAAARPRCCSTCPPASLAPSGKIFEYLAAERPVLCVTRPDNLAAQLVAEWDAGVAAAPSDVAAIAAALRSLYARWEAGDAAPRRAARRERVLARYSRRELTRQLAGVLDDATRTMSGERVLVAGWLNSPHVVAWGDALLELGYEVHLAGQLVERWPPPPARTASRR